MQIHSFFFVYQMLLRFLWFIIFCTIFFLILKICLMLGNTYLMSLGKVAITIAQHTSLSERKWISSHTLISYLSAIARATHPLIIWYICFSIVWVGGHRIIYLHLAPHRTYLINICIYNNVACRRALKRYAKWWWWSAQTINYHHTKKKMAIKIMFSKK